MLISFEAETISKKILINGIKLHPFIRQFNLFIFGNMADVVWYKKPPLLQKVRENNLLWYFIARSRYHTQVTDRQSEYVIGGFGAYKTAVRQKYLMNFRHLYIWSYTVCWMLGERRVVKGTVQLPSGNFSLFDLAILVIFSHSLPTYLVVIYTSNQIYGFVVLVQFGCDCWFEQR